MNSAKDYEKEIMAYWEKNRIYEKVKESAKNGRKFYFLDGPPYATGYIHIGTAMNKIIKDFYIRYFRMLGYDVWDQPGYDTHGVPIEHKIEKKLGFTSKKDIENFGTEKFIKECRDFATQFIETMNSQFANLGVWMDWKNPYLTLDNSYIEGAWYTFKKAYEKGLLYQGVYPVHVCTRCGTSVAYNEIEYEEIKDNSIYVKFRLKERPDEYLLIWTTTPWTLPSNTGVMANPKEDYVKFRTGKEIWIFAKQLMDQLVEKFGIAGEVKEIIKGCELQGVEYEHPLEDMLPFQKNLPGAHRVVMSEKYVTMQDGTGLVHVAPGHGQEDYDVGKENGLPIINPLSAEGCFDKNSGKITGMYARDANRVIIEELEKRSLLVKEESINHDYPFCWRCETPLLLMTIPQWFFRVTAIRQKMLEENEKVNWVPPWAKSRFRNWLESLGDWPVSRQRYWGIPLPIWVCDKCGNIQVIGSVDELPEIPQDLHKPYIDKVEWPCDKCSGKMRRVPDVLDVWFDSGVAPWASLGYPKNRHLFEKLFPVDFILEGPDQIRGWWNSLMITGIITLDRRPFENVLFHGFVMDSHGIKMSKSKGNIVAAEEIIDKYCRDVLRFYFLSGTPWEDYYFNWDEVNEIAKSFVIVRNVFNFAQTYVKNAKKPSLLKKEDEWIISRLNTLIKEYHENCQKFQVHVAARKLMDFVINDFSRWYIKIIRDRVWPYYESEDKEAAFYTVTKVAETVSVLMAPLVPFLAEKVYLNLAGNTYEKDESVHLCRLPFSEEKCINPDLEKQMELAKEIFESCSAARQEAGLKLRWPIGELIIVSTDDMVKNTIASVGEIISKMCNSKAVKFMTTPPSGDFVKKEFSLGSVMLQRKLDESLMEEAMIREVARKIQSMRKENNFNVNEKIDLSLISDSKTQLNLEKHSEEIMSSVGAKHLDFSGQRKFVGFLDFEGKRIEISFDRSEII